MANTLKIKRGTAATIPQGQLAEPLFTTDTYDLYIGKGSGGNQRIQNYIASGTSSQFLKGDGTLDSTSYQPLITAGTTLQYYRGDKTFQTLDTSVVPENGPIYFTEPRVRATVLTGLNLSGGGTIAATDSILTAFGKVQNQISALVGGATYQGTWNASTNTPTLASGTGTKGYYYVVSVAGSTNLDGITDWKIGDWAIFNGTTWDKVDNTDAVSSVNGFTGAVNLALDNISDVSAASPTNAQLLRFNGTSSLWENWTPTFEPALTKGNLTEATSSVLTITGGTGAVIGSGTTIEVASAGAAQNGVVTTGTQTFAGVKTFSSTPIVPALHLTSMTAGTGALYYNTTEKRLTLANYNTDGILMFEVNGGAFAMQLNADLTARLNGYTTNGILKVGSSNGTIGVAVAGDFPTLNQNTTGSAATLTTARTFTIGATGKTFDGSANVSWTLGEIGAAAALSGTSGRVAYWNSGTTIAADDSLLFSPTSTLAVNNVITAAAGGASAFNLISTINAAANNDILYGVRISPTFNNGAFTGVTQRALGVFGNVYINGTITSGAWNGSVIGSSYGGAGTVNGIMKANGSGTVSAAVAGTDYVIPSALSSYLPLSGGTLTGALSGTSATFSSSIKNNYLILRDDAIEENVTQTDNGGVAINYVGYNSGTSYFRNFTVFNGKGGQLFRIVGSTGAATFSSSVTANGNAATTSSFYANNSSGSSGTSQYYIDFTAGATTIGRIFRGNGASNVVANGLNIDNFDGFQVRLNQLGGSGGTFNIMGGNVGIGTTSPNRLTELVSSTGGVLGVSTSVGGASILYGRIAMYSTFGSNGYIDYGGEIRSYSGAGIDYSDLRFYTAAGATSVERMRITSGGELYVDATGTSGADLKDGAFLYRNNSGSYLQVSSGTNSNFTLFYFYRKNAGNTGVDAVGNIGYVGTSLALNGGSNSNQLVLTSDGEVLINTTTDSGAYHLQVNGSVYATAYYESSDIRLKDVLTNSYSENFSAIEFMWKDKRDDKKHWGYAAQDVMKYIPDAIEVNNDGMMTVNYNEAHTWKIAQLEAKIVELEAKLK